MVDGPNWFFAFGGGEVWSRLAAMESESAFPFTNGYAAVARGHSIQGAHRTGAFVVHAMHTHSRSRRWEKLELSLTS